jgi:hypothetical protein
VVRSYRPTQGNPIRFLPLARGGLRNGIHVPDTRRTADTRYSVSSHLGQAPPLLSGISTDIDDDVVRLDWFLGGRICGDHGVTGTTGSGLVSCIPIPLSQFSFNHAQPRGQVLFLASPARSLPFRQAKSRDCSRLRRPQRVRPAFGPLQNGAAKTVTNVTIVTA